MSQAADVRDFQRESLRQFTAYREINCVSVRSLEILVQAGTNEEGLGREGLGESCCRRWQKNLIAVQVRGRNSVKIRQAGSVRGIEETGGIGQLGRQTEGAIAAEIIGDALAEAVVHHPETTANRGPTGTKNTSE